MLEIIGNENVNLSEKQMAELIELLDKEEILEVESKIQKALDKAAVAAKEMDKPSVSEGKVMFWSHIYVLAVPARFDSLLCYFFVVA